LKGGDAVVRARKGERVIRLKKQCESNLVPIIKRGY